MKKNLLFCMIVTAIFLTSCGSLKTTTSKSMDIYGAGVIHKPVIVDLNVKETKVTGTATMKRSMTLEVVKREAVADALRKTNADVLVEPKFETITSHRRITATVTGFPATYTNFRQIKEEDVKLLQVGVTQRAEVYETKVLQKKRWWK